MRTLVRDSFNPEITTPRQKTPFSKAEKKLDEDNQLHTKVSPEGDVFRGKMKDGVPSGEGSVKYSDGDYY